MRKRLIWLFVILQLVFTQFAELNHNTSSRFAAMGAFCSGGFEISDYVTPEHPWTVDWARTPDGRYFSNKAPGTLFIGAPVYCALLAGAKALAPRSSSNAVMARVLREWHLRYVLNFVLCLLLQVLPWVWLCSRWDLKLGELGVDEEGRDFAMAALLFGTTPAIMMNIWIGHPIVSFFSMLALLALTEERPALLGLSLGMMQLTEYSSVLIFPAAFIAFPAFFRNWKRNFPLLFAGALLPAAAWVLYHERTFGGIFQIANRFQNPMFKSAPASGSSMLWGIFSVPSPRVSLRLVFGTRRGLLFSQPWVLLAALSLPWIAKAPEARRALFYSCGGLLLLLCMNASFNGWDGGASSGPRYLSAALPVFAVPLALCWKDLGPSLRKIFQVSLAYSCLVFALAKICGDTAGLWDWWPQFARAHTFEFIWKTCLIGLLAAAFLMGRSALHAEPELQPLSQR